MRIALPFPETESPIKKQCGNCIHFQTAPLSGLGWCRNRELRSEQERALVSRGDYRCFDMLDDYWEAAPELDGEGGDRGASLPFANLHLPYIKAHHVYSVVLSLVLVLSVVVLFSNNVLSSPVVTKTSQSPLTAVAKDDFWLREEATSAIPSVVYVMAGSKLELIDSKAGEILEPSLPAPSKWYKLKVTSSGDIGWAYSGWVERN